MVDPLSEVVALLQPSVRFSKVVGGAGRWRVRRPASGQPFYCVVLEGSCRHVVDGYEPVTLQVDDFVLIPSGYAVSVSSLEPPASKQADSTPVQLSNGEFRLGELSGPPDARFMIGHCAFASPDAALLVSLLPQRVHVRGDKRLATIVQLVADESRASRPAREVILARLLEVLFIESLRSTAGTGASPGLLRGLADERLAAAIRCMHKDPTQPWTVAQLAKEAALSRSAFFERFSRAVGVPPMEYLLAWRMAMAKNMLLRKEGNVAAVAARVGYSSASAFSVAFTRFVGVPPTRYTPEQVQDAQAEVEPFASPPKPVDTDTLEDAALLRRLLRAKDRMDSASHEAWPVKRLAKVSGVSEAHFARSFRRAFGLPPHRYLLTRRIEQAATLLRDTDMSITDIAFATGWSSLGTFGRIFRDITGHSPGSLRDHVSADRPQLARVPACVVKAVERPDLTTAVSEKRRRATGGTVRSPTKEEAL